MVSLLPDYISEISEFFQWLILKNALYFGWISDPQHYLYHVNHRVYRSV